MDDQMDALAAQVLSGAGTSDVADVLRMGLGRARNALTRRSLALALAVVADSCDDAAVDELVGVYRRYQDDAFLAPAFLEALGILAVRNPLARAELTGLLLRLQLADSPFLLVKAVKIIGRIEGSGPMPDLRQKLHSLGSAPHLAVQAEVRQQQAMMALADALLAPDRADLWERLAGTRAAFARAEASEEARPDAALFAYVLDMLLALKNLPVDADNAVRRINEIAATRSDLIALGIAAWADYRSGAQDLLSLRLLAVADAVGKAAQGAQEADAWTNFDEALVALAALYTLVRFAPQELAGFERLDAALRESADVVLVPSLGPALQRAVSRRRFARVVDNYVLAHGEDAKAAGLRALQNAAAALDGTAPSDTERRDAEQGTGQVAPLLSVDHPFLLSPDPTVDETIRRVLDGARERLKKYPAPMWARLVEGVQATVCFVNDVRDALPGYTRCKIDGGLGEDALEDPLQEGFFERLRQQFGRNVVFEHARVGGGRSDTYINFPECAFPIEVKRELSSVDREHVRSHYVGQPDDYATARDRVSILLILDLRRSNAAGHRSKRRRADAQEVVSLYRLPNSFWVDGLPVHPQIAEAHQNAVIIGLVPGNRPRPSSKTIYS